MVVYAMKVLCNENVSVGNNRRLSLGMRRLKEGEFVPDCVIDKIVHICGVLLTQVVYCWCGFFPISSTAFLYHTSCKLVNQEMETAPSVRNDTVLPSREYVASYEAQVVINVLLVILGIWSTFGNTLTILAITTNRETKTRANFIICSLAVSDLLSGIIVCPLWIYKRTWGYEEWLWGDSICKLYAFAMRSALYCTTWHITAFSILRYIAIRWPFSPAKIPKRKLKYLIIGMWMMALAFGGALHCLFFQVEPVSIRKEGFIRWPSCSVKTTDNGVEKHLLYYTVSTTCFILLPMGVLFVSSILITKELLGRTVDKTMNRIVKEHRAIAQLGLISTSYLIGYLPTICYVMWSSRTDDKDDKLDYWVLTAAYFCLRISECLNPIIYNVTSSRMRKASKRVLHLIRNCGRPNMELESEMHMNSVDSARKNVNLPEIVSNSGPEITRTCNLPCV